MGHHDDRIRAVDPQLANTPGDYSLRSRKPLSPRQLRSPIRYNNTPAKERCHAHQRPRIVSCSKYEKPLRKSKFFNKAAFVLFAWVQTPRTIELVVAQPIARKHDLSVHEYNATEFLALARK